MTDFIIEGFETNPGYDFAWDSTTESGGTLNPDSAHPVALPGGGSECLAIDMTSEFGKVFLQWTPSAKIGEFYYRVYFLIDSVTGMEDTESFQLMAFSDNSIVNSLRVYNDSGSLKLALWYNKNFTQQYNGTLSSALSLDTWYRAELHWSELSSWELRLDGATVDSNSDADNRGSIDSDGQILCGIPDTDNTYPDSFSDAIELNDTDWPGSIAGATDNLTSTDITTGSPTLGTPTIGQIHALTADDINTGNPVLDTPIIAQIHSLSAADITTGNPTLDNPVIGQVHSLNSQDITTGNPVLDSPVIKQIHALVSVDITTGNPILGNPILSIGTHNLVADDIFTENPVLDTPTIGQIHALLSGDILSGIPVLGNPQIDGETPDTPEERILTVIAQDRTMNVESDSRVFTIIAQNRTLIYKGD